MRISKSISTGNFLNTLLNNILNSTWACISSNKVVVVFQFFNNENVVKKDAYAIY